MIDLMMVEMSDKIEAEPMVAYRAFGPDGIERLTVDRFPPLIEISDRFLSEASPAFVQRRFDQSTVTFTLANGSATYQLLDHDAHLRLTRASLISQS